MPSTFSKPFNIVFLAALVTSATYFLLQKSKKSSQGQLINMSKLPSLTSIYLRAAASVVKTSTLTKGTTSIPPITLNVDSIGPFDATHIESFKSQVNISKVQNDFLPSTYLQCVTMPMPMEILSRTDFNILGSLHESCKVKSFRSVSASEKLSASATLIPEIELSDKNDILLRIILTINDKNNEAVQTIENQFRILNPKRHKMKLSKVKPETPNYEEWERFDFSYPTTAGRSYASLNGDINPIHVSPLAAKVFGYKSCIAHGMFSVCNMFSLDTDTGKNEMMGEFVRPIVLPRDVVGLRYGEEYAVGFYNCQGEYKVCVRGFIKHDS